MVEEQKSGVSYYKTINGVKMKRATLDLVAHLAKDGKIHLGDAKQIWAEVCDGQGKSDSLSIFM